MTRKEQNKILDAKIESNVNQYKVDRLNAEISAFSSGDLNKYEFLKRIDLNYKPNALDKARFEFSPLGKTFRAGLDKTAQGYQEEGVMKLLKDIRDNLAGGINIPAGLIIRQGQPGPQGPQGPTPPVPPKTTIKTPNIPIVTPKPNIPIATTVPNIPTPIPTPIIKPSIYYSPSIDLASTRVKTKKSNTPISTSKKSSEESEDISSMSSPYYPGDRFAIYVKEEEIKNDYDNIKYLENKLNDTSLSYDEYSKIYEDIRQARLNIPKKEQELDKLKKVIKDRGKILSKTSSDRIKSGINIEEHLLRIDHDNIDALNNKLKNNKLSVDEYNEIVNDIDKLKKSTIKRKQKDKLKKDLEKN